MQTIRFAGRLVNLAEVKEVYKSQFSAATVYMKIADGREFRQTCADSYEADMLLDNISNMINSSGEKETNDENIKKQLNTLNSSGEKETNDENIKKQLNTLSSLIEEKISLDDKVLNLIVEILERMK